MSTDTEPLTIQTACEGCGRILKFERGEFHTLCEECEANEYGELLED